MILLYSILLFSLSCQELLAIPRNDDQIDQLSTEICNLNAIFADASSTIAEQGNQISLQNDRIQDLEKQIEELEKEDDQPPPTSHTIFTRWGRTECPSDVSELVYSGLTGGSFYSHTGGAAEYVCLPNDPTWNSNKEFDSQFWGNMYGAEYEQLPISSIKDLTVPCAVCRTNQFSTVLMIPARSECYPGWQEAYHGELVSGHYNHVAASEYVCLDGNPEATGEKRGKHGHNGKLMYPVRAKCGALPCSLYEENALLTCVVCLK